jgi:hypothetical protein
MKSRCVALLAVLAVPLLAAGNMWLTSHSKAGDDDGLTGLKKELSELQEAFAKFKQADTQNKELISNLSRTSPPVGTVVAFVGQWPPKDSKGKKWTEVDLGWLLCDGRSIPYPMYDELAAVLGKRELPDLRGCFLRGVDRGMDGESAGRDADGGRRVGGAQKASTAAPINPEFSVSEAPEQIVTTVDELYLVQRADRPGRFHVKGDARLDVKVKAQHLVDVTETFEPKFTVPKHTHTLSAWDTETRPINVAVYWIIKFK